MSKIAGPTWIEVGSDRMRIRTVGNGQPLVVIINGFGAPLEVLEPLQDLLSTARQTIAFDFPGIGLSPGAPRVMTMRSYSAVVASIVRTVADEPVDVIGFSWGGAVAQQLARDEPRMVSKLVLLETMAGSGSRRPRMRAFAISSLGACRLPAFLRHRVGRIAYGGAVDTPTAILDIWSERLPSRMGAAQQAFALVSWSSLKWLHTLQQDTLVLSGSDDPLVPLHNATMLATTIPGAILEVVPRAGHLWPLENPLDAAHRIMTFLDRETIT